MGSAGVDIAGGILPFVYRPSSLMNDGGGIQMRTLQKPLLEDEQEQFVATAGKPSFVQGRRKTNASWGESMLKKRQNSRAKMNPPALNESHELKAASCFIHAAVHRLPEERALQLASTLSTSDNEENPTGLAYFFSPEFLEAFYRGQLHDGVMLVLVTIHLLLFVKEERLESAGQQDLWPVFLELTIVLLFVADWALTAYHTSGG